MVLRSFWLKNWLHSTHSFQENIILVEQFGWYKILMAKIQCVLSHYCTSFHETIYKGTNTCGHKLRCAAAALLLHVWGTLLEYCRSDQEGSSSSDHYACDAPYSLFWPGLILRLQRPSPPFPPLQSLTWRAEQNEHWSSSSGFYSRRPFSCWFR